MTCQKNNTPSNDSNVAFAVFQRFAPVACALLTSALLVPSIVGCGSNATVDTDAKRGSNSEKEKVVVVQPKEAIAMLYYKEDSAFNAAFRKGAITAAEDQKREIEWFDVEADGSQSELVDRAVKEKYAAICVCPTKPDTLKESVAAAVAAKIPVIVCEQPLSLEVPETPGKTVFVATDHAYCGQMIAEQATKMIDDDGKVLLIGGEIGVEADRAMNVAYALKDTKIEVIAESDVSTEGTAAVMTKFMKEAEDDSVAIVAVSAAGCQEVLKWKASEAGEEYDELPVLGFGSWAGAAEAIKSEALSAVVLEDPQGIGFNAVTTALSVIGGEEIGGNLVTVSEHLVTAENIDEDRTVELLKSTVR